MLLSFFSSLHFYQFRQQFCRIGRINDIVTNLFALPISQIALKRLTFIHQAIFIVSIIILMKNGLREVYVNQMN